MNEHYAAGGFRQTIEKAIAQNNSHYLITRYENSGNEFSFHLPRKILSKGLRSISVLNLITASTRRKIKFIKSQKTNCGSDL
jgi:hypothetical protein